MKTYNQFINESVDIYFTFEHLGKTFFIQQSEYNDKNFYLYENKTDIKKEKYIGEIEFKKEELSETFNLGDNSFPEGKYWYLRNIWVNREYVGKGLGKIFLNIIIDKLNINDFYLQSTRGSYKRWIQLGEDTKYLYRDNPGTNLIYIKHL